MAEMKERHFLVGYVFRKTYEDAQEFGAYHMVIPAGGIMQSAKTVRDMIQMDDIKDKPVQLQILSMSELKEEDAKNFFALNK